MSTKRIIPIRRPSHSYFSTAIRLRRHAAKALVRGDVKRAALWSYRAWQAECLGDDAKRAEARMSGGTP